MIEGAPGHLDQERATLSHGHGLVNENGAST
jgi:hypothetical protein